MGAPSAGAPSTFPAVCGPSRSYNDGGVFSNLCQLGIQCRLSPVALASECRSQCRARYQVRAHDIVLQSIIYNLRAKAHSLLPSCN